MNAVSEVSAISALLNKELTLIEYSDHIRGELAYLETTIHVFATPAELLAEAKMNGMIEDFYEPDYRDEIQLYNGRIVSFNDWWDNIEWDERQQLFVSLLRFWEEQGIKPKVIFR